jgi:hypothetical protein
MANTYTRIYIHIVFAAQSRQNLIRREHNAIRCRFYGADRNFRVSATKILLLRSIRCLSHGSNRRGLKQKIAPARGSFLALEMPTPSRCGAAQLSF